jgi:peptidyl-prolyl cis-trans isomerase B (cyclophilin B)
MKRVHLTPLLLATALIAALAATAFAADDAAKSAKGAAKPAAAATAGVADAALKAIDAQVAAAKIDKKNADWKSTLPKPTVVKFDKTHHYLWRLMTNKGMMAFEFKPDVAPMHVTNFIYLTRMGYFDGTKFHRVIKNFMAQGGDPTGTGRSGPGYQYDGEVSPAVKHDKAGVLSTANAGPNTDGSQFFIMFRAYPSLDMHYSIFGELVEGMDTLKAFEAAGNPGDGPPTEPLNILKATVEVK